MLSPTHLIATKKFKLVFACAVKSRRPHFIACFSRFRESFFLSCCWWGCYKKGSKKMWIDSRNLPWPYFRNPITCPTSEAGSIDPNSKKNKWNCFADCWVEWIHSIQLKRLTDNNTDVVAVDSAIGRTETDWGTDAKVGFNPIAFGLTEEFWAPLELDVTEGFFMRCWF